MTYLSCGDSQSPNFADYIPECHCHVFCPPVSCKNLICCLMEDAVYFHRLNVHGI